MGRGRSDRHLWKGHWHDEFSARCPKGISGANKIFLRVLESGILPHDREGHGGTIRGNFWAILIPEWIMEVRSTIRCLSPPDGSAQDEKNPGSLISLMKFWNPGYAIPRGRHWSRLQQQVFKFPIPFLSSENEWGNEMTPITSTYSTENTKNALNKMLKY